MWEETHSRNVEIILNYYDKIEENGRLIDGESEYAEWEGISPGQTKCMYYGMRHKQSGEPHGLVRCISDSGHLGEGSFKQGQMHGISVNYGWETG